jgi:hypothetical protein
LNVAKKRKFLGKSFEKIQTGSQFVILKIRIWTQIEVSKLGSGASSNLVGFRGLAFDED